MEATVPRTHIPATISVLLFRKREAKHYYRHSPFYTIPLQLTSDRMAVIDSAIVACCPSASPVTAIASCPPTLPDYASDSSSDGREIYQEKHKNSYKYQLILFLLPLSLSHLDRLELYELDLLLRSPPRTGLLRDDEPGGGDPLRLRLLSIDRDLL